MQLTPVGEEIWIHEGSTVSFYGMPYTTRMTVVRLPGHRLWIHSPEQIDEALQNELSTLGEVACLVSPNKLHHLFVGDWLTAYPDATSYAAPGLIAKRRDLRFDGELGDVPEAAWAGEIEQTVFRGSRAMEEVVFFHKASRTLILTDLIENFDPAAFNGWQRLLARFAGILAPHGRTPIDWRATFLLGDRRRARAALKTMLDWQPENIVISHGRCIFGDGTAFLAASFDWLAA